jgi:hypothetical protein
MKKIILLLSLFFFLTINAQETNSVSYMNISIYQDINLLYFGDKMGNDALTTDILIKYEIGMFKLKNSSVNFNVGLEYADLTTSNFYRFFVGIGYAFQVPVLKKIKFTGFVDHGLIFRGTGKKAGGSSESETSFMGVSLGLEASYPIYERLRVSAMYQLADRKDLAERIGTNKRLGHSLFVGVKYEL